MDVNNDISIIIPAFIACSGIAFCAAVQFGLAGIVGERSKLYLAFSAVCLCAAGHLYLSASYYSAHSMEQAARALRWQAACSILSFPIFFLFVALYTGQKRFKVWLMVVSLIFASHLIANFALPYGIRFSTLQPAEPMRLPWGESLARFSGEIFSWIGGARVVGSAIFLWAIWRLVALFRRSGRLTALLLAVYCVAQLSTALLTYLTDFGAVNLFYTSGFVFIGLVLLMSASLALEFHTRNATIKQRERSLTESEIQLRGIISSAMDAIISVDANQRIVLFNDAAEKMFGCPRHEVIGEPLDRFIPDRLREADQGPIRDFGETNVSKEYVRASGTSYARRSDGQEFPVESSVSQLDLHGRKFYTLILRDVTERKQAEDALREREARFRNIVDNSPLMMWLSGPDNECTWVNQVWLDFRGRSREEELGTGWVEGVHPDDLGRCLEALSSAFDRKEAFAMEVRIRRADGEFRWIYGGGTPNFSPSGELMGYIGSNVDITDRKQAEASLGLLLEQHKQAEETLRLLLDEVNQLKNQLEADNIYLQEEIKHHHDFSEIVGASEAIKRVLSLVEKVAPTDTTVLVTGETGTGKELVARAIHSASSRSHRAFVKVNCAALPATLIESELFGHERGAFTGAEARKPGRFELANGATFFLDEIGELPPESQVKLLRVLQEGEFERLGSSKTLKADVRIIAATNRDLNMEVERGVFRSDLWYRLNVFPIVVPPLRERREDIPALVAHFAKRFSVSMGKAIESVAPASMDALENYSWPGNVRELANVIERAVISSQGSTLRLAEPLEQSQTVEPAVDLKPLEEMERDHIVRALIKTSGRIEGPAGAAKLLGLNPSTLRGRMAKLGIRRVQWGPKAFGAGG
jgi:PAS domain S-box-containing protein